MNFVWFFLSCVHLLHQIGCLTRFDLDKGRWLYMQQIGLNYTLIRLCVARKGRTIPILHLVTRVTAAKLEWMVQVWAALLMRSLMC